MVGEILRCALNDKGAAVLAFFAPLVQKIRFCSIHGFVLKTIRVHPPALRSSLSWSEGGRSPRERTG
jgi:hypothetical protein